MRRPAAILATAIATVLAGLYFGSKLPTTSAPEPFFAGHPPPPAILSSSVMPADRFAGGSLSGNWTTAGLTTKGGLSAYTSRSTICTTLNPIGGGSDDSAQINNAIAACAAGGVVKLNAGAFVLTTGNIINLNKGVTLRGAGPASTSITRPSGAVARSGGTAPNSNSIPAPFGGCSSCMPPTPSDLDNSGGDLNPIVLVGSDRFIGPDDTTSQNLTTDGVQGATSITVSSAAAFSAGMFVLLDETTGTNTAPPPHWGNPVGGGCAGNPCQGSVGNSSGSWGTSLAPNFPGCSGCPTVTGQWSGDRVAYRSWLPMINNGQFEQSQFSDSTSPYDLNDPSFGPQRVVPFEYGEFSRVDRAWNEMKEIASVSGNAITFTSPLTSTYRASHHAQVTALTSNPITLAGVEGVKLIGAEDGAVHFSGAAYSWVWNTEIIQFRDGGVKSSYTFRIQVQGVYIHSCTWPVPGGAGYNIDMRLASSEFLIQDNITIDCDKTMVVRAAGAGGVIAYNYSDDGWISGNETIPEVGINASHAAGSHHVLLEGNYSWNAANDFTHGSAPYNVFFRNWLTGQRRDFIDSVLVTTIGSDAYSWYNTYIGNVLGYNSRPSWIWSSGAANTGTAYTLTDPQMNCDASGGNCVGGINTGSWLGTATIWAFGFDPQNGNSGAEPKTLATTIRDGNYDFNTNAQHFYNTPRGFTMPDSLYLSGKPAFFGSNPWPWVNPANGATQTLPALARYNAATPNSPVGP